MNLNASIEIKCENELNLSSAPPNLQLAKLELQRRVIAHNVKQFFINRLPICRICLETEDDSKGTATLNSITPEIWKFLKLNEEHFPKWICTKCERIVIDFMLLTQTTNESNQFIKNVESSINDISSINFKVEALKEKIENVSFDLIKSKNNSALKIHDMSDTDASFNDNIFRGLATTSHTDLIKREFDDDFSELTDSLDAEYLELNEESNETRETAMDSQSFDDRPSMVSERGEDPQMDEEYLESEIGIDYNIENKPKTRRFRINPDRSNYEMEGDQFKCLICQKLSSTKKNHTMHVAISHTKPHQCPIENCGKWFGLPALVRRHILQMHSGKVKKKSIQTMLPPTPKFKKIEKLNCVYCNQVYTEKFRLNAHVKLIHAEATLFCNICGKNFNEVKMKAHLKTHEKPYECDLCSQRYGDKFLLKKHIQEKHLGRKDYLCNDCGQRYGTAQKLRRHILHMHVPEGQRKPGIMPDEQRGFCKHCGLRFADKTELINHSKEHSLVYKCKICCRRFATEVTLLNHEATHEDIEYPFECSHCKGKYKSKIALNKHMSKIHITRRWICSLCNKTLSSHRALISHEKQHQGVKEYDCFFCDKQFASGRRLKEHLIAVHTESRYQCPNCTQKFVCSRGIIAHLNRDHPGTLDLQPDVSIFFTKDEPQYSFVLEKYRNEMIKRNEMRQETENASKGVKFQVIELGFFDRKEIDEDTILQDTMLGCE